MKCLYTNANSVLGKMQELRQRMQDFDVVGITETWATGGINDAEISVDGFNFYRLDREGMVGGGLLVYVNDQLDSSLCLEMMDSEFKEALWCNIRTATGVVLIGLCYRSPSSSATNNDHLLDMFRAAMNRSKVSHVMIFADFNYPDIDYWHDMVAAGDDAPSAKFFHTTQELFLRQCVCRSQQDFDRISTPQLWTMYL